MARLSEQVLETGRGHIRAKDLNGFLKWAGAVDVPIDLDLVGTTFAKCFAADDVKKALRMFEAAWGGNDVVTGDDMANAAKTIGRVVLVGKIVIAFVLLGAASGIAALVYAVAM